MRYRLRPKAERDIYGIMSYIGGHNPRAALDWQDELFRTFAMLAEMPEAGVRRVTSKQTFRLFPKGNYLIFYGVAEAGIEIIRVLHAARDWPKRLG